VSPVGNHDGVSRCITGTWRCDVILRLVLGRRRSWLVRYFGASRLSRSGGAPVAGIMTSVGVPPRAPPSDSSSRDRECGGADTHFYIICYPSDMQDTKPRCGFLCQEAVLACFWRRVAFTRNLEATRRQGNQSCAVLVRQFSKASSPRDYSNHASASSTRAHNHHSSYICSNRSSDCTPCATLLCATASSQC
jgi:hypothetical protein